MRRRATDLVEQVSELQREVETEKRKARRGTAAAPVSGVLPGTLVPYAGTVIGHDSSGDARHASAATAATPTTGYWSGTKAIDFNGSSTVLSVPSDTEIGVQGTLTMFALVKVDTLSNRHRILSKSNSTDSLMTYEVTQFNQSCECRWHTGTTNTWVLWPNVFMATGTWYWLEISKSSGNCTLWVNGVTQGAIGATFGTLQSNTDPLQFGAGRSPTPIEYFDGQMALAGICNNAMSQTDANAHWAAVQVGKQETIASLAPQDPQVIMGMYDEPEGYLLANGQAVSRTTYADLFAEIGTLHGVGDGTTTFNVPDLTGDPPTEGDWLVKT